MQTSCRLDLPRLKTAAKARASDDRSRVRERAVSRTSAGGKRRVKALNVAPVPQSRHVLGQGAFAICTAATASPICWPSRTIALCIAATTAS
jgi:hypothetical protein